MIRRTYMCPECAHRIEVDLPADQWNAPPPSCEACDAHDMQQEFMPPRVNGSIAARAAQITENIIRTDYGVANYNPESRQGGVGKIRYNDQPPGVASSSNWSGEILQQAIAIGKQTRRESGGDGLDTLKRSLASGAQPDLIEASKRKAIKVW